MSLTLARSLLVTTVTLTCWTLAAAANDEARTWTSRSGEFEVQAEFAGAIGKIIKLRKSSGQVISVPLDQLSAKDRAYVAARRRRPTLSSKSPVASQLMGSALLLASFEGDAVGDRSSKQLKVQLRGPAATPGISGKGLRFDGKDDHVEIAALYPLLRQNRAALSVSLWLRRPQRKKTSLLFDAGFFGHSVALTVETQRCRFIIPVEAGGTALAFKLPPGDDWRHVVATWDSARQIVYLDGKRTAIGRTQKAGKLTNKTLGGPPVVRLGSQAKAPNQKQRYFRGELDEVAVFSVALTPAQVRYLHQLGSQGNTLALVANARPPRSRRAPVAKLAPKQLGVLRSHAPSARAVAFSPDGKWLASSNGKEVKVTDLKTRKVLKEKKIDYVQALAFSRSGKELVLCSLRQSIWDLRADRIRQLARNGKSGSPDPTVRWLKSGFIFHAFGDVILPWDQAGDAFGAVRFEDSGNSVSAWNITDDGKLIAGAQEVKRKQYVVRLIDYQAHEDRARFSMEGRVTSVAFSGDGALLAVGLGDKDLGKIHLYDVKKKTRLGTIPGKRAVQDMEFVPNSHILITSQSYPGIIRIWNAGNRKMLAEINPHHDQTINCLAVFHDGATLALGRDDGQVELWAPR